MPNFFLFTECRLETGTGILKKYSRQIVRPSIGILFMQFVFIA